MGNLKHIEVELKFPLFSPKELIQKLNSIAKSGKREDYQKDIYYVPPHRNFIEKEQISEWLRIRETRNGSSLNYKNWHNAEQKRTISCDEFETNIDNLVALKKMFESLNFKEIVIVEKTRNTWVYKDVGIAIDNVKDLGFFIELEATGKFNNVNQAKEQLYKILKELNARTGPQDFRGYPYRLLEKKGYFNQS